jgi:CheY-like chemotaxis protein
VNHRILIAEPDAEAAQRIALRLGSHAYEVHVVGSTEEAIRAIRHFMPDVALLDIEQREDQGLDTARLLRHARQGRQKILLLALTGFADGRSRDAAHAAGFDVVVPKPVDADLLAELLEGLLQTRGADAARGDPLDRVLSGDA